MNRTVRRRAASQRPASRSISFREAPLPAWSGREEALASRDAEPQLRAIPGLVLRAEGDDDGELRIAGKGAVTDDRITFGGRWYSWDEEIAPGAFDDVLEDDIRSMFNHNVDYLLGRTSAGTLEVSIDDDDDLAYSTLINRSDPAALGVHARVARGDVSGSSIMFQIAEETATYATEDNGLERDLYVITRVEPLYEVGPVVFPAYENTTAEAAAAPVEAVLRAAGVPAERLEDLVALALAAPDRAAAALRSLFGELPDLRDAACSCSRSEPLAEGDGPRRDRAARYAARRDLIMEAG